MDRPVVAVDNDLSPYEAALARAGYEVVILEPGAGTEHSVSAIVVDGLNDRVMGIDPPRGAAPIINAAGLTADEVVDAVNACVRRHR